jgi:hypothetical protein
MLPGFRFLFTAIVLSMSVLVLGLGAAALLRAAHEQFASIPSWHAAPEASLALQTETQRPVLSMLRVQEPATAEQPPSEAVASANAAVPEPAEQAAVAPPPSELERVAALEPQQPALVLPVKPGPPVSQGPAGEAETAREVAPVAEAVNIVTPDSSDETGNASTGRSAAELPPANEPAAPAASPAASSQTSPPASPPMKIATLDSPSVAIDTQALARAVVAKLDPVEVRKRLRARRAALRRRLAERARQAEVAAQATQQAAQQFANPFIPPFGQPPLLPAPPRNARVSVPINQNRAAARPL